MDSIRQLLARQRFAVALIVMMALLARLLVPAGYMPNAGQSTLTICTGQGPQTIAVPDIASRASDRGSMPDAGGTAHPCDYAPLGMMATGDAGPPLMLVVVAPALTLAVAILTTQVSHRPAFLRPPLRAPPLS